MLMMSNHEITESNSISNKSEKNIHKLSSILSTRNANTDKIDKNTLPEPKSIVPSLHSSFFKSNHYLLLPPPPPPPYEAVVAAITSNDPYYIMPNLFPHPLPPSFPLSIISSLSPPSLLTSSIHSKSLSFKRERKSRKQPHELLTKEEKKANHIASEQKRRQNIRLGFDQLIEYVPTLNRGNRSEAIILQKSVEHIRQLILEKNKLKNQIRDLQSILGDLEYEEDSSDEDLC